MIFFWWYRDDPQTHRQVNAQEAAMLPVEHADEEKHFHVPWKRLFSSRTVWCLCGQYFACSYCFYFFITWFPSYLLDQHGFDMKQGAMLAGTPLMLAAVGSLFAGWLSPILSRRWTVRWTRRWLGAVAAAGAGILLTIVAGVKNPFLAVTLIALVAFFNDLQMPGAWTACMDVGGRSVGTLSGTMNMMGNFGGFLSPIVTGYVVQQTGEWTAAFYVTAITYALGVVCWLAMDPVTPLEEQTRR